MKTQQNKDPLNPTINFNKKFYRSILMRIYLKINRKVLNIFDGIKDKKICDISLVKYVPTPFCQIKGSTGSESTSYFVLNEIFKDEQFKSDDNFIDIGCGKGRVIAYLLKMNFPGNLYGIEHNDAVANFAKKWSKKYNNVSIINGDAFVHNLDSYNIFFLGRPFETEFFKKFINKFENDLTHPVKVFYWWDQQSGDYLNHRDGWYLHKRSWIFKKHGLYLSFSPQRYSIWTYTPANCRK